MANLPTQYAWLADEPGPKMLIEALKLFGVKEVQGPGDNPEILSWAKELGLSKTYSHDEIPWCGLFIGIVAHRAGKEIPDSPLWALAWADFGDPVDMERAELGDILTFKRNGGGHVGMYVGEDDFAYHVLGGNQHDEVCITRVAKARLYRVRRPHYNNKPDNVRKIVLSASGKLSHNEA